MSKNIAIALLSICLVTSVTYIFAIQKSAKILQNLSREQSEYSELARTFTIEYNNMYRDKEHEDTAVLKDLCTEELWQNYFADAHPSVELPDKLEINTNNIEEIVCQVAVTGAKVVVYGSQTFEYNSYRFVYLIQLDSNKKVSAFNILMYSE